jgi:hypothetical protein
MASHRTRGSEGDRQHWTIQSSRKFSRLNDLRSPSARKDPKTELVFGEAARRVLDTQRAQTGTLKVSVLSRTRRSYTKRQQRARDIAQDNKVAKKPRLDGDMKNGEIQGGGQKRAKESRAADAEPSPPPIGDCIVVGLFNPKLGTMEL